MSEWREEGQELVRDLEFKDFAEALAFVNRVGELAEEANHHPDILDPRLEQGPSQRSRRTPRDAITDADHEMAARIDGIAVASRYPSAEPVDERRPPSKSRRTPPRPH